MVSEVGQWFSFEIMRCHFNVEMVICKMSGDSSVDFWSWSLDIFEFMGTFVSLRDSLS